MLQQTRVAAAVPYFHEFLARWPTVEDLAQAKEEEVIDAWAGLGYYARARALHQTARIVAKGSGFPRNAQALQTLPGIGPYTAGAVAALAFGERIAAVDGNVLRVLARVFGEERPLAEARKNLQVRAAELVPANRPGDHAEALMELGALVCTPRKPRCGECPWRKPCHARKEGKQDSIPSPAPTRERSLLHGVVFRLLRNDGRVLFRRRQDGPLAGTLLLPGTPWGKDHPSASLIRTACPAKCRWRRLPGFVEHDLTHLTLRTEIREAALPADALHVEGEWRDSSAPGTRFPGLTRKLLLHAIDLEARAPSSGINGSSIYGRKGVKSASLLHT